MTYDDECKVKKMIGDNDPGCLAILLFLLFLIGMPVLYLESYNRVLMLEVRVNALEARHSITNVATFPKYPLQMLFKNETKEK